jgi:hypothetical protein
MRAIVITALCIGTTAAADDATDFGPLPVFPAKGSESDQAEDHAEKSAPIAVPATTPQFSPTTGSLLSAAFALKSKEKSTTITVAPFKLTSVRPVWGLQFSAANDSGTGLSTFGAAYRAEWRWLLAGCYSRAFDEAYDEVDKSSDRTERNLLKTLDRKPINLIPVLSVGGNIAVFPVDLEKDNQHAVAEQNVTLQLAWRFGTYAQADVTGSVGRKRLAVDQDEFAATRGASATTVVLVPQLLGLTYYDSGYLESASLFQRGIGLGGTIEYKKCAEGGDDRALCPDGIHKSTFVGVVLDLRVAKDIAPRFIFGQRRFTKFVAATEEKDEALEAGVVIAFTIKN